CKILTCSSCCDSSHPADQPDARLLPPSSFGVFYTYDSSHQNKYNA
ncbi:uncharacterized, partial [Tachysurus ichikawai]